MAGMLRARASNAAAGLLLLFAANASRADQTKVEAYSGEPYGVGCITVTADLGEVTLLGKRASPTVTAANSKLLYPAHIRGTIGTHSNDGPTREVKAYFLFQGTEKRSVTLQLDAAHSASLDPQIDDKAHAALLHDWWRVWTTSAVDGAAVDGAAVDAYVPVVENYLLAMLSRRLDLPLPEVRHPWSGRQDVDMLFGTLSGAESVRLAMQKETVLRGASNEEPANVPLPDGVAPPKITLPPLPAEIDVEPLALRVPEECFYIRCSNYSAFRWLLSTINRQGGDLRNLLALRGLDYGVQRRLEQQLSLRETVLSGLLGDTVIEDLAIIGNDTFFREGASVGLLFQARNGLLLGAHIRQERQAAREAHPELQEEKLEIAGHEVSLLSSADQRVRSFYAVEGDFHLVTTSRAMVRGFFEASEGKGSLGQLDEFRHGRTVVPLSRGDAVFVYLSDPFFRAILGAHYRVEMTRRMQADADLEVVQLARRAAQAEGHPSDLASLMEHGFLPRGFAHRPDGSHLLEGADGRLVDSLRGARRSFLPVSDVEITKITASEHRAYLEFSREYERLWRRMDPVVVGIQVEPRKTAEGPREKVTIDAHITPYATQHYWFTNWLGMPDRKHLAPIPGVIATLEARAGPIINAASSRVFVGLLDFEPTFAVRGDQLEFVGDPSHDTPAYLGTSPANVLGFLVGGGQDRADAEGYEQRSTAGFVVWGRIIGEFDVVAQHKEVLQTVTPHLGLEEAPRPAQIRLHVGDLRAAKVAGYLDAQGFMRAAATSRSNSDFLRVLCDQLGVPPDTAVQAAEEILEARLACALGGTYELESAIPGDHGWRSTAAPGRDRTTGDVFIPGDYHFPLVDWVRGMEHELSADGTSLSTHVELDLAPQSDAPTSPE